MSAAKAKNSCSGHSPQLVRKQSRAAPRTGGRCKFTWRRGLFISFWLWGWLRSRRFGRFPAKTSTVAAQPGSRAQTRPTPRGRLASRQPPNLRACRQRGPELATSKRALGPASPPGGSERGSEGGPAGWSRGPRTRSAAAGGRRAGSALAAAAARRSRPGHPAARPPAWEGRTGGSAPRPAARRAPSRPAPSQRAGLTGASSPRAA